MLQIAALSERLVEEVHQLSGDRRIYQQREGILMSLLTGSEVLS